MELPVIGEAGLAEVPFYSHFTITDLKSPNGEEGDLIITQLAKTRPQYPSRAKRRKSKPMRFEVSGIDALKESPSPDIKIGEHDPLSPNLSLQKEKLPTKRFKTLVPSSPAMIQAVEVQSRLGTEFRSCIKMMVKSQVSCGFWMGLPLSFCKSFLPKEDTPFILEDENGQQWEVKYIAYKSGLSAGWKTFAVDHKLIEGDVLVFHLVEYSKFKVYIFKGNDLTAIEGGPCLLNFESPTEHITPVTPSPETKRSMLPEPLPLSVVQKKHKKSTPPSISLPNNGSESLEVTPSPKTKRSKLPEPPPLSVIRKKRKKSTPLSKSLPNNVSERLEGTKSYKGSKANPSFQEFKSLEDFCTAAKDLHLETELSDELRMGYYKLCLDRKQFLHDGLREGLFYKLVAGIIGETVTIANEIKNCKPTTTQDEFEGWDSTLKSFELLGMKVGFLRDRIHILSKMAMESEGALDIKRYLDSRNEQKHVEDEIKKVEDELLELKETAKKFEGISSSLRKKAEKYEEKFQNQVDAPW